MAKQTASAPRTEPAKAPGKKRSRSVAKPTASIAPASTESPLRAPTHGEIATRAYSLYAARGFRAGDAVQDWLQAEQQLRAQ